MLLDVTLTNYRSVKETMTVSFEAVTDKSLDQRQLIPVDEDFDLVKIAAMLGPNGSGKSAVLRAVESVQSIVLAREDDPNPLAVMTGTSFAFDREWASRPSRITIRSVIGIDSETGLAKVSIYTLEADREKIHRETLHIQIGRSTRRMYERILQPGASGASGRALEKSTRKVKVAKSAAAEAKPVYTFFWGKTYEGSKKKLGKRVPCSRSFLQAAAAAGVPSVIASFNWFRDRLSVIPLGISGVSEQLITDALRKRPEWRRAIVDFLWSMDLMDIRDVRITDKDGDRLIYVHGGGDSRFATYFTSESLGVRRLTLIAVVFMEAFLSNRVVISDDFSLFLHPEIIRHLIRTFIRGTSASRAQLFISGVDSTLLDDSLIRRDGIWFVTRGRQDGSIYYSLSDYKYRQKHNVTSMYRLGAFGALPILSDFYIESLKNEGSDNFTHGFPDRSRVIAPQDKVETAPAVRKRKTEALPSSAADDTSRGTAAAPGTPASRKTGGKKEDQSAEAGKSGSRTGSIFSRNRDRR